MGPTQRNRSIPPPLKGRGTAWSIPHRFESRERTVDDDGWGTEDPVVGTEVLPPETIVVEEHARSALASNDSPDIPFDLAVNPYRGCEHGCIYCYARPTHGYLNLSPGLDFETRLVAKVNIAERLREELSRRSYRPSAINIGSATDAYQPVERRLRLTRQVIELLLECRHPYTIVTKSAGIVRDIDLLAASAERHLAQVFVSVTTLDPALARQLEPRAAAPFRRLSAVRRLHDAGVPVAVNIAPIIPFLNEPEIEHIVAAAAEAGASSVHYTVIRLPWEVAPLFKDWLARHAPERAARILARIQELHGLPASKAFDAPAYRADFVARMKGQGPWAALIRQRVHRAAARHGLALQGALLDAGGFVPPGPPGQGQLF